MRFVVGVVCSCRVLLGDSRWERSRWLTDALFALFVRVPLFMAGSVELFPLNFSQLVG
jgi:hypothetical protein